MPPRIDMFICLLLPMIVGSASARLANVPIQTEAPIQAENTAQDERSPRTRDPAETGLEARLYSAVLKADVAEVRAVLQSAPPAARLLPTEEPPRAYFSRAGSPLSLAVEFNETAIVRLLIEHGADVNRTDHHGLAPLHFVRTPEMVTLLVAAGADPAVRDAKKQTPLTTLSNPGRTIGRATADALIALGVKPTMRDAIRLGKAERLRELATNPKKTLRTADVFLAIDSAREDDTSVVEALLDLGAPLDGPPPRSSLVNASDPDNLVLRAIHCGSPAVATLLLERGADVPDVSARGIRLVRGGNFLTEDHGDSLDRAIALGHEALVARLLTADFHPDMCDRRARLGEFYVEPRMTRAAWLGDMDVVAALLTHGATLEPLAGNCSAGLVAAAAGRANVYDFLVRRGMPDSVHALALMGRTQQLAAALDESNIDAADGRLNGPPLAWAMLGGDLGTIELLLARGANPNARASVHLGRRLPWKAAPKTIMPFMRRVGSSQDASMAALAVRLGRVDIAEALLASGATPDASLIEALAGSGKRRATELLDQMIARDSAELSSTWVVPALRRLLRRHFAWEPSEVAIPAGERLERLRVLLATGPALTGDRGQSLADLAIKTHIGDEVVNLLIAAGAECSFETACLLNRTELGATDTALAALDDEARGMLVWQAVVYKRPEVIGRLAGRARDLRGTHARLTADPTTWTGPRVIDFMIEHDLVTISSPFEALELGMELRQPESVRGLLADSRSEGIGSDALAELMHDACIVRSPNAIRMLLEAGTDPNRRSRDGKSTIEQLFTFEEGDERLIECVALLLEGGADPMRSCFGHSMIFEAWRYGDLSEGTVQRWKHLMRPHAGAYLD